MQRTKISYLELTWNPLAMKCTPVSAGCDYCWHRRMANRHAHNLNFSDEVRAAYAGETGPVLVKSRLDEPARRKKPAVIGVQFMGDLWHRRVKYGDILRVMSAVAQAPQHTYVFLTKRSERMLDVTTWLCDTWCTATLPPNWWGMVTVENQEWADKRIPDLLAAPWAVRGISAEPLLGEINLFGDGSDEQDWTHNGPDCERPHISWCITGGETGPGARPTHLDWARGLRDQCVDAGVPYFHKHNGEWIKQRAVPHRWTEVTFMDALGNELEPSNGNEFWRVGNKRAGHLLDGVEWQQMPEGIP